jgi:hypothetical protein
VLLEQWCYGVVGTLVLLGSVLLMVLLERGVVGASGVVGAVLLGEWLWVEQWCCWTGNLLGSGVVRRWCCWAVYCWEADGVVRR